MHCDRDSYWVHYNMTFIEFAKLYGLILGNIIPNEVIRCPTIDHPEKQNGAYLYSAGRSWVMNWSFMTKPVEFNGALDLDITEFCIPKERPKNNPECIQRAKFILSNSSEDTHPYLTRKGINEKVRVYLGDVVIPVVSYPDKTIRGLQIIYPKDSGYSKRFLSGTQLKGGVNILPSNSNTVSYSAVLCEGFATGLSIWMSTNKKISVVVCFCASNIVTVAKQFISLGRTAIVYADNDEVGLDAAVKAKVPYVKSDKKGNDANDDMNDFGPNYIHNKINSVLCVPKE